MFQVRVRVRDRVRVRLGVRDRVGIRLGDCYYSSEEK